MNEAIEQLKTLDADTLKEIINNANIPDKPGGLSKDSISSMIDKVMNDPKMLERAQKEIKKQEKNKKEMPTEEEAMRILKTRHNSTVMRSRLQKKLAKRQVDMETSKKQSS